MNRVYFPEAKAYRIKTALSIKQLSKLAGVDQKLIILLESGEEIEETTFVKIAKALNKILKEKKEPLIDIDFIVNGLDDDGNDAIFF
ncbi:MAG TPA: helix-turn-helix transcriptional regulator [Nitrospinota bacterium]|jgi:predicted transcriptional regulator|nr:helix-turn-helix transcriptional regulator [Nitrospinota bacterium]|tara:strand:- start:594 stop:854 length:261 start_codon:yes stop_codon:yes gene_type:complete